MTIHGDWETRSTTDLTKSGVHRYAEDPNTRPWLLNYSIAGGPVQSWRYGDGPPLDLLCALEEGMTFTAHNAAFERVIWNACMVRDFPWAQLIPIEQMRCTMVRALTVALPGSLDKLGEALQTKTQKDMEGSALMKRMMKPRSFDADGQPVWWDEPEKIDRLDAYCKVDVEAETEIDGIVPHLNARELELWQLDQHINERGVKIDVPLVERLSAVVAAEHKKLDAEMAELTDGFVSKCSQAPKIREWLNNRGIECTSIAKGEQEELFARIPEEDAAARRVFGLRNEAAKAPTKLKAMQKCVCNDGRARDQFQFNGAATRRWAGRLIQLQNLKRVDVKRDLPVVLGIVEIVMTHTADDARDIIKLTYGPVMPLVSLAMRACIVSEKGKKFVSGDLANIEGRVAAWITDERWKVDSFHDYDAGTGPDNYKLSYSRSFGVAIGSVGDPERQIGKVQELALGYQGSVGAYLSMAAIYSVKPNELARAAFAVTDADEWLRVAAKYGKGNRHTFDLDEFTWTGVRVVVEAWRRAHPQITQAWWDLQDAAIEAVSSPGRVVEVLNGRVQYVMAHGFLLCRLPSGGLLWYPQPWLAEDEEELIGDDGKPYIRRRTVVRHKILKMRKWISRTLYGGLQFENIVQSTARDILTDGMTALEAAGYPIVMTVHDENVSEVDENFGSPEEYASIMARNPEWCKTLPLAAKAWEDRRYVK